MVVAPSDFRLTFAGDDFMWAAERRPGLPILRWVDGSLCEPVLAYFGWSAETNRVRISSMKPEAYAIREWLAFVANKGRKWDNVYDLLLRQWRESHRQAIDAGEIEARQVERKIEFVFNFYRHLPTALPLDARGEPRRPFVGASTAGLSFQITSKIDVDKDGVVRETWVGSAPMGKKQTKRPTPDEAQVGKVLDWLRSKTDRQTSGRTGDRTQEWATLEAERNWLIARCMVDGGLRAEEAADLSVAALEKALRSESVPMGQNAVPDVARVPCVLDTMSGTQEARSGVLKALDGLEARHRKSLYVEITGKGRKTRMAPFAIDLIRDLLEIGVWTVRRSLLAEWKARDKGFKPPLNLFLSFKTKDRLSAGAVSDLMKDAFKAVGVDGSGHRLRAHYATIMAARLWDECFAMNGYRFDQTVVNMALDRLAEAMGHAQVTTTARHYLDMALLRHFGVSSRAKLDAVRTVWDAVVQRQGALSEDKVRLIVKVVDGLATMPDGSDLEQMIALTINDTDLNQALSKDVGVRQSRLTVVK